MKNVTQINEVKSKNLESNVKYYCKNYTDTFSHSSGSFIYGQYGEAYLDFLSGCGSLNYGHNNEPLKKDLLAYIENDGIAMSLDMYTDTKINFINTFNQYILEPRGLDYLFHFTGPTGTNAVEAAIKISRKFTGRTNIIAFTNAFHGCTLGSLSLTANSHHRSSSAPLLNHVSRMPFDGYMGENINTADLLESMLLDPSSGIDMPAAIIFEPVQGEGGLNIASKEWAQKICAIAKKHGILVIADEIQSGCGRTGKYFGFEHLGITPDIVTLSKSLSGYGLPFGLALLSPTIDVLNPGEHNGTFRGNNHAFVTSSSAIKHYWKDDSFEKQVAEKSQFIFSGLHNIANQYNLKVKGIGMMSGLEFPTRDICEKIRQLCFQSRLIIETCGPEDNILKIFPPLTISREEINHGITIITDAIAKTISIN